MKTSLRHFYALTLTLFGIAQTGLTQELLPLRGHLSLPTKNWGVELDLPDFTLDSVETKPDGRRYMIAENKSTHVVVSLTLEQVEGGRTEDCTDSLQKKAKHPPFKVRDIQFSRQGDFDLMEYIVPEVNGRHVNQKSTYACEFYDSSYIDLHLSKVNYSPSDAPLLADVLKSAKITNVQRTSLELVEQASRLYIQHDYKGAIGPYSQALELEKSSPKLNKPLWFVLIDNLGMSYGITGDLQKAKATFEYGVSKEPTYPLFYYNLACTYAEMNDVANASSYLKKAFEYKANILSGESMPDPRRDNSFKKLMKNKDFQELAKSLAGSP